MSRAPCQHWSLSLVVMSMSDMASPLVNSSNPTVLPFCFARLPARTSDRCLALARARQLSLLCSSSFVFVVRSDLSNRTVTTSGASKGPKSWYNAGHG